MRKMRKFEIGGMASDDDALEAKYKAAGLAASNAENKKSSGFFGRLGEGNIDEKGSEAYNKYGAGYGRKIEADRAAKSEDNSTAAAPAATAKYKGSSDYSDTADMKRNQGSAAPTRKFTRVTEDMPKTKPEVGGQVTTGDARIAEYANAFPSNRDEGLRAAKRGSGATTGSGTAAAKPPAAKPPAAPASKSDNSYADLEKKRFASPRSGSASGSGGGRGPTYAQVDAEKQKGFAANPMSKDPSQRAKPAASAPAPAAPAPAAKPAAAEKPLSQAQQRAQAAIARATGNSSGAASYAPTSAEAERNRANFAKKAGDAVSSVGNYFKNFETPAERRSRLAKEAKSSQKAGGGAIRGYASGGSVSASSRGDGIAQRGKTRGKMC